SGTPIKIETENGFKMEVSLASKVISGPYAECTNATWFALEDLDFKVFNEKGEAIGGYSEYRREMSGDVLYKSLSVSLLAALDLGSEGDDDDDTKNPEDGVELDEPPP